MQQSNLNSESAIHLPVAAQVCHMAARQILPCIFNNCSMQTTRTNSYV